MTACLDVSTSCAGYLTLPVQSLWPHRQAISVLLPTPSQWGLQYFESCLAGTQLQAAFAHFLVFAIAISFASRSECTVGAWRTPGDDAKSAAKDKYDCSHCGFNRGPGGFLPFEDFHPLCIQIRNRAILIKPAGSPAREDNHVAASRRTNSLAEHSLGLIPALPPNGGAPEDVSSPGVILQISK